MYIHVVTVYIQDSECLCHVYTCLYHSIRQDSLKMYMSCLYMVYTWYIHVYTDTLALCGTSLLHGGQSSTDPLVPGWLLNPYHSSQIQEAQEFWLSSWHLQYCSSGWTAREQCVWGKSVYMFTIVCTGINMYIHGTDAYMPLCQILSIWSGFYNEK
jgi:hypothetical protein